MVKQLHAEINCYAVVYSTLDIDLCGRTPAFKYLNAQKSSYAN